MLDLTRMSKEAQEMAARARAARCCDALRPCYRCMTLRRAVIARRRVIKFPTGWPPAPQASYRLRQVAA